MSGAIAAERGKWGEQTARCYYEHCGYTCLAERYRCPAGEVDLVMARPGLIVFVEVKVRGPRRRGRPEEAVSRYKLTRLRQVARHWLWRHRPSEMPRCRFDVVAIAFEGDGSGFMLRQLADVR